MPRTKKTKGDASVSIASDLIELTETASALNRSVRAFEKVVRMNTQRYTVDVLLGMVVARDHAYAAHTLLFNAVETAYARSMNTKPAALSPVLVLPLPESDPKPAPEKEKPKTIPKEALDRAVRQGIEKTKADRKRKAAEAFAKLQKKDPKTTPVIDVPIPDIDIPKHQHKPTVSPSSSTETEKKQEAPKEQPPSEKVDIPTKQTVSPPDASPQHIPKKQKRIEVAPKVTASSGSSNSTPVPLPPPPPPSSPSSVSSCSSSMPKQSGTLWYLFNKRSLEKDTVLGNPDALKSFAEKDILPSMVDTATILDTIPSKMSPNDSIVLIDVENGRFSPNSQHLFYATAEHPNNVICRRPPTKHREMPWIVLLLHRYKNTENPTVLEPQKFPLASNVFVFKQSTDRFEIGAILNTKKKGCVRIIAKLGPFIKITGHDSTEHIKEDMNVWIHEWSSVILSEEFRVPKTPSSPMDGDADDK